METVTPAKGHSFRRIPGLKLRSGLWHESRDMWEKNSIEHISPERLASEFFRISEGEVEGLRKKVLESKGRIVLLVHPFFESYFPAYGAQDPDAKKEIVRLEKRIEKFLNSTSTSKPPVIIFEATDTRDRAIERLQSQAPRAEYLMVRTLQDNPKPFIRFHRDDSVVGSAGWHGARKVFHVLGVKDVLLGGMYLHDKEKDSGGCVNETARQLKDDFRVEISSFAFPLARKDFRVSFPASAP